LYNIEYSLRKKCGWENSVVPCGTVNKNTIHTDKYLVNIIKILHKIKVSHEVFGYYTGSMCIK
jgi:hypothetical protein